jgi:hypothetical protein
MVLLRRPARRTHRPFFAAVVPLALALGVGVTLVPGGKYQHGLHWVGSVIGEVSLVLIFGRLFRITRVEPHPTSLRRGGTPPVQCGEQDPGPAPLDVGKVPKPAGSVTRRTGPETQGSGHSVSVSIRSRRPQ